MPPSLMRRLEWSGVAPISKAPMCPICHHVEVAGHKRGCELDIAITAIELRRETCELLTAELARLQNVAPR